MALPDFHLRVPLLYPYSIAHIILLLNRSISLQPYVSYSSKFQRLWPPGVPWHCCPQYNAPPPLPVPQFVYTSLHLGCSQAPSELSVCTVYEIQHKFMSRLTLFPLLLNFFLPSILFMFQFIQPLNHPINDTIARTRRTKAMTRFIAYFKLTLYQNSSSLIF